MQSKVSNSIIVRSYKLLRLGGDVKRIPCPQKDFACCKVRPQMKPETKNPTISTTTEREMSTIRYQHHGYKCGEQRPDFNLRLFNPDEEYSSTLNGEFPWNVAIYEEKNGPPREYKYRCGGSLIHPQIVLTAAHCIKG